MNVVVSAGGKVFFGETLGPMSDALGQDGSATLYETRELALPSMNLSAHDVACGVWEDVLGKRVQYGQKLALGISRIANVDAIHQYCGGNPPWK